MIPGISTDQQGRDSCTPRLTLEGIKQFFVAVEREQSLGVCQLLHGLA